MEIWIFYAWAVTVFILSAIHLYKANLGCSGFIIILLFQIWTFIFIVPAEPSISRAINGLEFAFVLGNQVYITFLLFINSALETTIKSFKYKTITSITSMIVLITLWLLFLLSA